MASPTSQVINSMISASGSSSPTEVLFQIFNNPEFGGIHVLMMDDTPWWIGKELTKVLGYANTGDAISKHV